MQRVLVVRIGRLGDTVLATPVIGALQASLGDDVSIDFACSPGASARILGLDRRVNRVFPIAHRGTPWRLHRVKRELERHSREYPYDLVINLETGRECDDFVRFVHHREFCGRPLQKISHMPGRHCVDTEKAIYAARLGENIAAAAGTALQLDIEPQSLPVPLDRAYVVINPGFSGLLRPGYRSHRGWPLEHWQVMVEELTSATGLAVLVNGTPDEQPGFAPLLKIPGVHSLFGSSLPALCTALENAAALVTVDTGTMHLATALGTPVVALFGPTDPTLTGPYSNKMPHRVMQSGIDCQPCAGTPLQKKCTFNRCMTELGPARVLEVILSLINIKNS
jgi:ADP-heptose:LPS heptosyltransferase